METRANLVVDLYVSLFVSKSVYFYGLLDFTSHRALIKISRHAGSKNKNQTITSLLC